MPSLTKITIPEVTRFEKDRPKGGVMFNWLVYLVCVVFLVFLDCSNPGVAGSILVVLLSMYVGANMIAQLLLMPEIKRLKANLRARMTTLNFE